MALNLGQRVEAERLRAKLDERPLHPAPHRGRTPGREPDRRSLRHEPEPDRATGTAPRIRLHHRTIAQERAERPGTIPVTAEK